MTKEDREMEVFIDFSKVAPFSILPDTIENRHPPEPDILCQIDGIGKVGFELTELVDEKYMAHIGMSSNIKEFLNDYLKNGLDQKDSALFYKKYRGALLHFEFLPEAKFKERKAVAKKAFIKLLSLPDTYDGEVLKDDLDLTPVLEWVNISRINLDELIIDSNSYVRLGNPTALAITKKLDKKYQCNYPIELLVYINFSVPPHEEIWKSSAKEASSKISKSHFRKIWVFDNTDKIIKYEHPKQTWNL